MKARLVAATMIVDWTAAATTVIGCGLGLGLRINLTPSYPRGLWQIVALDRSVADGDLRVHLSTRHRRLQAGFGAWLYPPRAFALAGSVHLSKRSSG